MKKTLLQHATIEQEAILSLARPFNEAYAVACGFDYIISNMARRLPQKPIQFEKLGYLNEMLPKLEEGSLVVWADSDTVCIKNESFENALPPDGVFGMVRSLHGLNASRPRNWWNNGVIVMKNIKVVRDFLNRVSLRDGDNDEIAMVAELSEHFWTLREGVPVTSIDYKWNCWKHNSHVCKDPVAISWHGYKGEHKLTTMKKDLKGICR